MVPDVTRRSLLATLGLTATAGCLSLVSEDRSGSRRGTTDGSGFSDREFGADATAPMVRYDAGNTGATPAATGPTSSPGETWTSDATLGTPARPTALGEMVFLNSVNGLTGFTADGGRRWAYDTRESELNPSPPVVVRDRVFATRTTAVFAVDAKVGAERWVFTPPRPTNRLSAPAVSQQSVYVVGQHPEEPPALWAIARVDGSVRWHVPLGGEAAAPPVVADGTVYCVTTEGGLYAVDPTAESVAWEQSLSPIAGPPAVGADGVFVAARDGVSAYDRDGTPRWTVPDVTAPSERQDGLVVHDGTVYASSEDGTALVALAAETGDERWRAPTDNDVQSPVVAGDTLYTQDTAGSIRALGADEGTERWATRLDRRSLTGLALVDGGLVVGADERFVRYG